MSIGIRHLIHHHAYSIIDANAANSSRHMGISMAKAYNICLQDLLGAVGGPDGRFMDLDLIWDSFSVDHIE